MRPAGSGEVQRQAPAAARQPACHGSELRRPAASTLPQRSPTAPGMLTALQMAASCSTPMTSAGAGWARRAEHTGWTPRHTASPGGAGALPGRRAPCPPPRHQVPPHPTPWFLWGRPPPRPHSLRHRPQPSGPAQEGGGSGWIRMTQDVAARPAAKHAGGQPACKAWAVARMLEMPTAGLSHPPSSLMAEPAAAQSAVRT